MISLGSNHTIPYVLSPILYSPVFQKLEKQSKQVKMAKNVRRIITDKIEIRSDRKRNNL